MNVPFFVLNVFVYIDHAKQESVDGHWGLELMRPIVTEDWLTPIIIVILTDVSLKNLIVSI